jgi:phosphate transport system substrate-binding protein
LALFLIVLGVVAPAEARERVRVVGSATVLPFVRTVAEQFARHFGHPGPSLEVTGAGPGFRLFCAGIGFEHPDAVVTARPIFEAGLIACKRNGVEAATEIEFGWDAVTVISDKRSPRRDHSRTQLFAALAREVEVGGVLVTNTAGKWSDIDSALPNMPIRVAGAVCGFFHLGRSVRSDHGAELPPVPGYRAVGRAATHQGLPQPAQGWSVLRGVP